jgi:membrane protease YdiL (CAAX protease family)
MSRIERRPVGAYGLPGRGMFGWKFWLGFLFGLAAISLLIALISAFGGYTFGTLALHGSEIFKSGLLFLVGFTFVGLFEEFLFRGYTQFTLGDGIGFWPAAALLSLLFGGAHLQNPGEGWVGAASVVAIALFFCFSLKRTGDLWFAVGLHASFDWGETFLYSVPNSGAVMKGHLSSALIPAGPKWLTGGTVGPEGSVFCFLTVALLFLVVMWLFPAKKSGDLGESVTAQS